MEDYQGQQQYPNEAEWMNKITNDTICNFYYVFFVVYAVLLGLTLISFVIMLFVAKGNRVLQISIGIQSLLIGGIATTFMLFFYLMCDRALLSKRQISVTV